MAALSGRWAGQWGHTLDHVLVVEKIDGRTVTFIYSWGVAPAWNITTPGFQRVHGTVGEDGVLQLKRGGEGHPTASCRGVAPDNPRDCSHYGVAPSGGTCRWSGAIDTKMFTSPPWSSDAVHRKVRKPFLPCAWQWFWATLS
jgi:hypothetical protein